MLDLYKLDCYRVAIELLELLTACTDAAPRGHADDIDQLLRAAKSIIRNIAEGAGRRSVADKARIYTIARGEAFECVASLDVLKLCGAIGVDHHARAVKLLERIVSMLTRLIASPGPRP